MALPIASTLTCLLILASVACIRAKVFERCELAQLLKQRFRLSRPEVAIWVCIAQHTSSINTATYGGSTGPGGGSHGLFQISDVYWCDVTPGQVRGGCNLPCARLRDEDLTDDLACAHQIHAEHQRISGDGYTAWQAYEPYCKYNAESYIAGCSVSGSGAQPVKSNAMTYNYGQSYKSPASGYSANAIQDYKPAKSRSKIYNRCELAQELYYKHQLPMEQIPTWVCIAQHESSYDTSAVGRLNTDGSADHGLFQISDLYWCSHERSLGGKACGLPCSKLLDTDITDDVRCIKRIYNEHTGISGDGFTAWTVYNRDCRNQRYEHVAACFNKPAANKHQAHHHPNALTQTPQKSYANPFLTQVQPQPLASYNTNVYARPPTNSQQSYQTNPFLHKALSKQPHPNAIAVSYKTGAYITHTQAQHTIHQPQKPQKTSSATSTVIQALTKYNNNKYARPQHNTQHSTRAKGKVYKRCELAQEMYFKHKFPMQDIATWVCIAEHESRYDTSAIGRLNEDGSADHGLFQISDLYWCTHDQRGGKGCGLPCEKLIDSDITDDVACIRTIYEEHTRISGDGFTAWVVYNRNCRQESMDRIVECFGEDVIKLQQLPPMSDDLIKVEHGYKPIALNAPKGKIYNRCELAQELYFDHKMPMQQIPTWVCIAKHESSFNTAAVGRLNTDGSADHGLFQVSDLFWCTHDQRGGKGCNIPCERLLDSDITDDISCIKTIHEEHTRISGDGFTAWVVYNRNCRQETTKQIADCFDEKFLNKELPQSSSLPSQNAVAQPSRPTGSSLVGKGKIYKRCELAQELYFKHKMPMQQIPTWVCIAKHESSFNTTAVGRLNTDGSADHGLFQISDLYWCAHDAIGGKACNIPCSKLLDNDISDDVRCIKIIYSEHTRISGDGFTAWTVYNQHCRQQHLEHVSDCFEGNETKKATVDNWLSEDTSLWKVKEKQATGTVDYSGNIFLNRIEIQNAKPIKNSNTNSKYATTTTPKPKVANTPVKVNSYFAASSASQNSSSKLIGTSNSYKGNPFLNNQIIHSDKNIESNNKKAKKSVYHENPFLSGYVQKPSSSEKQSDTNLNEFKNHKLNEEQRKLTTIKPVWSTVRTTVRTTKTTIPNKIDWLVTQAQSNWLTSTTRKPQFSPWGGRSRVASNATIKQPWSRHTTSSYSLHNNKNASTTNRTITNQNKQFNYLFSTTIVNQKTTKAEIRSSSTLPPTSKKTSQAPRTTPSSRTTATTIPKTTPFFKINQIKQTISTPRSVSSSTKTTTPKTTQFAKTTPTPRTMRTTRTTPRTVSTSWTTRSSKTTTTLRTAPPSKTTPFTRTTPTSNLLARPLLIPLATSANIISQTLRTTQTPKMTTTRTTRTSRTTPTLKATPTSKSTSSSRTTPTIRQTPFLRTTLTPRTTQFPKRTQASGTTSHSMPTPTQRPITTPTLKTPPTSTARAIQTTKATSHASGSSLYHKFQNATNNIAKTVYAYGFGQNRTFMNKHEGAKDFETAQEQNDKNKNTNEDLNQKSQSLMTKINPIPVLRFDQQKQKANETINIFDLYLNWNKKN